MKRTIVLTAILFISTAVNTQAQSTQDSVKAVINQLFTAMRDADSALLKTCFSERYIMQTIVRDKDGSTTVKSELLDNFASQIAGLQKGAADERIVFDAIKIDGPLASVWTPYQFYFNGQFSHCGANSFQLLRTSNGWKIQYLIDTRRKDGCN